MMSIHSILGGAGSDTLWYGCQLYIEDAIIYATFRSSHGRYKTLGELLPGLWSIIQGQIGDLLGHLLTVMITRLPYTTPIFQQHCSSTPSPHPVSPSSSQGNHDLWPAPWVNALPK